MLEESLAKLGFSPSEIKIYIFLLKNGCSYPHKISSETKINRSNIYEALDRLVSKGVVSFINKNKVKWFGASPLKSVLSLIQEQEEEIKKTKDSLLNELNNLKVIPKSTLEANIFVGKKGLRMIFEEILELKKPISLLASKLQFQELFGPYFELWHSQRINLKISQRSIFPKYLKSKLKLRDLLEYKFVDDLLTNPTTTIIYGDNCVFIQWSETPIAIKITNPQIAKSHQNYFDSLWKIN